MTHNVDVSENYGRPDNNIGMQRTQRPMNLEREAFVQFGVERSTRYETECRSQWDPFPEGTPSEQDLPFL